MSLIRSVISVESDHGGMVHEESPEWMPACSMCSMMPQMREWGSDEATERRSDEGKIAVEAPTPLEPRDLPEIVSGLRIRQMTPFGNMHVKITVDLRTNTELEVFAQLGKGGDLASSDIEAICRMISLWLRANGPLKLVIKQLSGIGSSLQIPTRSGRIMSLGDGLACALKKYVQAKERFGLRALLLGEIDPAEMDNPLRPPHGPANIALDRTIHAPDGNGSGNGNGHKRTNGDSQPSGSSLKSSSVGVAVLEEARPAAAVAYMPQRFVPRDPGSHYKLKCPECCGDLVQQEGCQKCFGCGWSQC